MTGDSHWRETKVRVTGDSHWNETKVHVTGDSHWKETKVRVTGICTPIIFKNPLNSFFNLFRACLGCNVIVYFLFEKATFNGLLKVIGSQIIFAIAILDFSLLLPI